MILEAFSKFLLAEYPPGTPSRENDCAENILHAWLGCILSKPSQHGDHVSKVIHREIMLIQFQNKIYFEGRSNSGCQLLDSLYSYCKSYEYWQFSRWLHCLRASDFTQSNSSNH